MDHLKTDQERKDRWYSHKRRPRFVSVVPATDYKLFDDTDYHVVRSIPHEWLLNPPPGFDIVSVLQRHGFLVVSGVLTPEECKDALSLSWEWIKAATVVEQARRESLDNSQTISLYKSLRTFMTQFLNLSFSLDL